MTQPSGNAGLHVRYEKAGLILDALPIPWNADAVIVEANVRLPAKSARTKQDFTLRLTDDSPPLAAELVHEGKPPAPLRVFFRIGVPARTLAAEVYWREHALGRIDVPILPAAEFLAGVAIEMPTLHATLGQQAAPCRAFVGTQVKTVLASAIVRSTGPLAPAFDLDLRVEVHRENGQLVGAISMPWTSDQLRARQTLVTLPLPKLRWLGVYQISWHLGTRCLHAQTVRAVAKKAFQRSLRICGTRFVLHKTIGTTEIVRALPRRDGELLLESIERVSPCFLVCTSEVGMAGLAPFTLRALVGEVLGTLAIKDDVLVTDGPTPIVLGSMAADELPRVERFSLASGDQILGNLTLLPAPVPHFTAEGGFAPLDDFLWSPAADEQLKDRLGKLLDGV